MSVRVCEFVGLILLGEVLCVEEGALAEVVLHAQFVREVLSTSCDVMKAFHTCWGHGQGVLLPFLAASKEKNVSALTSIWPNVLRVRVNVWS